MRKALWKKSRALVKAYSTPLGEPWEKPEKPQKQRTEDDDEAQQEVRGQDEEQLVEEDWGVADKKDREELVDEDQFFPDDDDGEL